MHPRSQPSEKGADELETAVDEAIAACGGDMRSTIRALIVANEYLESEACELMAAPLCARPISYLFRLGERDGGRNLLRRSAVYCY